MLVIVGDLEKKVCVLVLALRKLSELGRPDGNRGVHRCVVLQGRQEFTERKSWRLSWSKSEGVILMRAEAVGSRRLKGREKSD